MTRRSLLQGAAPAALAAQGPAARPNILWICSDQQRWDTIGGLGHTHVRTPNLDRLARDGVAFTRAYCQNPICTPSRASFLTGCYPSTVHVHRNGNSHFPADWAPRLAPRLLQTAGYDCGLIGKLHLAGAQGRVEPRANDGYRLFDWSHHPKPEDFWPLEHHAYQRWLRDRGVDWNKAYRAKKLPDWPSAWQPGITERHHELAWAGERAKAYFTGGLRAPWMISVNVFAPHPPFDPAPEFLERVKPSDMPPPFWRDGQEAEQARFAAIDHQTQKAQPPAAYEWRKLRASYAAMVEHVDHMVGGMLDALEASGQRDNTVVVFASDHGEMIGDHGLIMKGCRFFEGAVRIPLIVSWPARFRKGLRSNALVELTDILPTILDAAGVKTPEHVQGKSLAPVCEGRASPDRHRDFVRAEYHDTIDMPDHTHATMIRDERYKLVTYHNHRLGELFDLAEDPHELRNLYDQPKYAAERLRMTEKLFDAMMCGIDIGQPRVGRF